MSEEDYEGRAGGELLEREAELATLERMLERASAGEGAIALIEGPAGIGKSSLAKAVVERSRESGMAALGARGSELERDFPLGIVRQLFEPALAERPTRARERLLADAAALAAPVFAPAQEDSGQMEDGSEAVLHGLYWLVANLVAERPLVLVVDDVHWADRPSLRFLAYLANRIDEHALLLVLGSRPFEPGADTELVDEIAVSPRTEAIRPAPLTEAAVRELARRSFDADPEDEFAAACLAATKGNPFLLRELLGSLRFERVAPTREAAAHVSEIAPRIVARSVLRRVDRLPGGARELAEAVAVLGGESELAPAARLAGLDPAVAAEVAAALERAGVFAREALDFVHPIVRAAIYDQLSPVERAARHREAARVLADLEEDDDRVAVHLLASEPGGEEWAVGALRRAARRARAGGAPEGAVAYLARALAEPPPPASRPAVLMELGRAEAAAAVPGAQAHMREALGLTADPRERALIALDIVQDLLTFADFREAAHMAEQALTELDGRAPDVARRLESRLMSASLWEPEVLLELGSRIGRLVEQAEREDDPAFLAPLAMITVATTEPAEAGARIARRAFRLGLSLADTPDLYAFSATSLMAADQLEESRAAWDRAREVARRSASLSLMGFVITLRAIALVRLGAIAEAEADTRETLERLPPSLQAALPFILAPLVDALVERGRLDEADRLVAENSVGDGPPQQLRFALLFASIGRLRAAQGRPREAVALLREAGRRLEGSGVLNPAFIQWRSDLVTALGALGETDEARELARRDIELARLFEVPRALGMALRADALVGEPALRIDRLREAVSVLEGTAATLELARALTDLGAALRREGRRVDSREPLRRGLDLAHRCGADALVERARTELRAAGARPRRLVLTGPDSLTVSERRVAELAAAGLTNRKVAQALFVTEKTVEGHLQHAYRKLGIRSREELAEALAPASGQSSDAPAPGADPSAPETPASTGPGRS